ncbi:MAG TPA: glycosyltransferase [Ruminiclostridium sp.]|nr:glycosyltransferase [Ruminiclostridium sp.]
MIFEDPSKKRWNKTVIIFTIITVIAAVLITNLVYSMFVGPHLKSFTGEKPYKGTYVNSAVNKLKNYVKDTGNTSKEKKYTGPGIRNVYSVKRDIRRLLKEQNIRSAFVNQGDPQSVEDMKMHIHSLNVIFPNYFNLSKNNIEINENVDASFQNYVKKHNILNMPTLSNSDSNGDWLGNGFEAYIKNKDNQSQLCSLILNTVKKYDLQGINLDIEDINADYSKNYTDFLARLADLLHKNDLYLSVDVPLNDGAYDYKSIGQFADFTVVMAYDEHYPGGESGPIADNSWFNAGVEDILKVIPKEKAVVSVGQYAYDWDQTHKAEAKSMGFDEVMALGHDVGAKIQTDKDSCNSYFSYKDSNGDLHNVWILDAVSLWNEMQEVKNTGVLGAALWRTGLEDPGIWGFYSQQNSDGFSPLALSKVQTLGTANFDGNGEILNVDTAPKDGIRNIRMNGKLIDYAEYSKLPTNYEVKRFGHLSNKEVVLTFDDGPDPRYTDQVLDVLKANNVKGTFFVVGEQAQRYPYLVKRELREGNLVGNHTYFHPDVTKITDDRLKLELNAVQRLIEAISGKQTILFRTPYNTDSEPSTNGELEPLYTASKMGYVAVGADIDSSDYEKPGVNKIIQNIMEGLKDTDSNIIVMHDAGGNRDQTIKALKVLIPSLKKAGYKFVNINDLLGVPTKSLMPDISVKEQFIVTADKVWTWLHEWGWNAIVILFFISTLISVLRILFLGTLVLKSRKSGLQYDPDSGFKPFVSVLIPAYNEEKVIEKTLVNLMKGSYKNFEAIVIDDGSTDTTAEIVNRFMLTNSNVRLITKKNEGKYSALNLGFKEAKGDYVVTIDADTIILPDTIEKLITPFANSNVDAVCGNVQVGNNKNILTGFQTVEYITTQNYDRRAFDVLNCISVVPGATGAWKKEKVIEAGGYSPETLTEDADLTLTMLEHGARIVYASEAKSVTEAPESVSALFKQRFRWSYGTFQCLWKHRKSLFKGNLGLFALPNMFIFQLLFPVLSPIGDAVFILSLFRGDLKAIMAGYILFLFMDFAGSLMAFTLEKAPKKYLWLILIQRFFYRQFMYCITFKTIFAALRGNRHGWNKLERTSSVKVAE